MPTPTYFAMTSNRRACSRRLDSHDDVVVEKAAGVRAVRAEAADHGGEMDDEVRARVAIQALHGGAIAEVAVFRTWDSDGFAARELPRPAINAPAEEAGTAGDDDACGGEIHMDSRNLRRGALVTLPEWRDCVGVVAGGEGMVHRKGCVPAKGSDGRCVCPLDAG